MSKKWYNVLMTFTQKTIVTLLTFLVPASVMAVGAPRNVRGIQMNNANGAITVTWNAVQENVAFYRVYYSHTSILGNQGNYDDFERTRGLESAYTFSKAPLASGTLFVSVLAVSPDGSESEGFEEEASIDLGSTPTPVTPAVPTVAPSAPMTITSVGPISSTGILVTFSEDVALDDATAIDGYFVVTDTGGILLAITRVNVVSSTVLIHTDSQIAGKTYILSFAKVIPGVGGGSIAVTTAPAKFLGFTNAVVATEALTPVTPVALTPPVEPVAPAVYVRNPYITPPTVVASVATEPVKKDRLPDSGVGLLSIAGLAGAGAITRRLRRKKTLYA